MKSVVFYILVLFLLLSCGKKNDPEEGINSTLTVVTSNFAIYDFARVVGGEKVNVEMLLSPGVEAHSYEPTPRDMVKIGKSDLFICISKEAEPWIATLIRGTSLSNDQLVESGEDVRFLGHDDDDHSEHRESCNDNHDDDNDHGGLDPHIWLDPVRAQQMVATITSSLIRVHPEDSIGYRRRSDSLITELEALHKRFESTFEKVEGPTILYAGHFAFGYFSDRYGVETVSPYSGFSPNAEPSPRKVADLVSLMKSGEHRVIYYAELVEPRVAETIVRETGAEMALLHGIHNVSSTEKMGTFSYLSGMEQNRINIENGLVIQ